MQAVQLFSKNSGQYRQANRGEASNLLQALERCYAPATFSERALEGTLAPFAKWMIASGEKSITISEWMGQLSAQTLAPDFKTRLAALSSAGRFPSHCAVLEPFQLGRFCEFRAALIASRSRHVESAQVAAPNSPADAAKSDITLMPKSSASAIQLQVKAVDGSSKRKHTLDSFAVLRRVWLTPLCELQQEIEKIILERIGEASPGVAAPLEYE